MRSTLIALCVGLLASTSCFADCVSRSKSLEIDIVIPGNFFPGSPDCVREFGPGRGMLCAPAARTLSSFELNFVYDQNTAGQKKVEKKSDRCVEYYVSVRAADHRGVYPNYICSPGRLKGALNIFWCD